MAPCRIIIQRTYALDCSECTVFLQILTWADFLREDALFTSLVLAVRVGGKLAQHAVRMLCSVFSSKIASVRQFVQYSDDEVNTVAQR